MANARALYTGNGSTQNFTVSFPFISRAHVFVSMNLVDQPVTTNFTWLSDSTIRFNIAPPTGAAILVYRETPRDVRLVDFTNGSVLTEAELDLAHIQHFYTTQELTDEYEQLLDGAIERIATNAGIIAVEGTALIDAMVQEVLESAVVAAIMDGVNDAFTHPATGAVATTLGLRGRLVIYPQDLGAVGDGVTDDTAALQACITGADGRVIDLQGLTYKAATTLSLVSDTTIKNGGISFATASDGDVLFEAYGSAGTQYTLSAAPVKGATSVSVSSATGLAAGDYCFLKSTDNWSAIDSGKRGEWVRVLSVAGLVINLESRVRMTYTAGYTMYKPTLIQNIKLESLVLTGKGYTGSAAQYGLRAYLCKNVQLVGCSADSFGYAAYSLETVLGGSVRDCNASRGNYSLGAAYGLSISGGCEGISVSGGKYNAVRHGVSVGGTFFTDYGHTITGVNTLGCSDAGIDIHPNAMNIVISDCEIDCYSVDTTQTGDGITAQGASISIIGNIIRGWARAGILCQPLTSAPAEDDGWVIVGNSLINPRGVSGADGIVFSNEKGAGNAVRGLVIANNLINGGAATTGRGILIQNTTSGGPIRGISIAGNVAYCRSEALSITAANLELIEDVSITGNSLTSISAALPVITLVSNADVSKYLSCVVVGLNAIRGGTYGISLSNAPSRVMSSGNIIQGWATAATLGTFVASNGDNYSS